VGKRIPALPVTSSAEDSKATGGRFNAWLPFHSIPATEPTTTLTALCVCVHVPLTGSNGYFVKRKSGDQGRETTTFCNSVGVEILVLCVLIEKKKKKQD